MRDSIIYSGSQGDCSIILDILSMPDFPIQLSFMGTIQSQTKYVYILNIIMKTEFFTRLGSLVIGLVFDILKSKFFLR